MIAWLHFDRSLTADRNCDSSLPHKAQRMVNQQCIDGYPIPMLATTCSSTVHSSSCWTKHHFLDTCNVTKFSSVPRILSICSSCDQMCSKFAALSDGNAVRHYLAVPLLRFQAFFSSRRPRSLILLDAFTVQSAARCVSVQSNLS